MRYGGSGVIFWGLGSDPVGSGDETIRGSEASFVFATDTLKLSANVRGRKRPLRS